MLSLFILCFATSANQFVVHADEPLAPTIKANCDPIVYPNGCMVTNQNFNSAKQTDLMFSNVINSLGCLISGVSLNRQGCASFNNNSQFVYFNYVPSGGLLGLVTHGVTKLIFTPPASGVKYISQTIQQGINIGKPAYAQVGGTGARVIQPIQALWQTSRNIAYIGFTIIFVAIGFMIMFRAKLGAETAVSIQSAIPGLVVGLVLVTFSYIIAGLVIDFSFILAQLFGIIILSSTTLSGTNTASGTISNILSRQDMFTLMSGLNNFDSLSKVAAHIGTVGANLLASAGAGIGGLEDHFADMLTALLTNMVCGGNLIGIGGVCTLGAFLAGPAGTLAFVAQLILFVGLFVAMGRLFLALIGAYVAIILNTIFGPFLILFSAIPGKGELLTQWLMGLIANALVFPVTFGFIALVAVLASTSDTSITWNVQNNSIGSFDQTLPLFGGFDDSFIRYVLAYGMILASAAIPGYVKELLSVRENEKIGQEAQRSATTGFGFMQSIAGRL